MDLLTLIFNGGRAENLFPEPRNQLFRQPNEVGIVRVGDVELQHGELRVVNGGDPLVPEVSVDLEDAGKASHDQPLEIQLRGNPKVEIHAEGVVMGDERSSRGATGNRLHHRRLDFEEPLFDQKRANAGNDAASGCKNLMHRGIRDQVHVPLPVASLHVRQAMPLFRERPKRFAQKRQLTHLDRELIRLGSEELSADADPVA